MLYQEDYILQHQIRLELADLNIQTAVPRSFPPPQLAGMEAGSIWIRETKDAALYPVNKVQYKYIQTILFCLLAAIFYSLY
jgi:hypothetical protein